jgi:uncharacterized membrane protein
VAATEAGPAGEPAPPDGGGAAPRTEPLQLGLIATPSLPADAVAQLGQELAERLSNRYPHVEWEIATVRDGLVTPPAPLTELVDAARASLLEGGWDLAVVVTELPLRLGRRPLLTHASPTHRIALVSLPALGVRQLDRRLLEASAEAVSALVSDTPARRAEDGGGGRGRRVQGRLVELVSDVDDELEGVSLVARVLTGNVRLILGMIRANRPWRLVGHLSRALLGALGAAAYAIVASDVWRIAASLSWWRLLVLMVAAVAVAIVTLIVAHELWERARDRRTREQVVLFNLVTLITVTFGILSLYAAVFATALAAGALTIDSSLFTAQVGRHAGLAEYLRLAWFASSLATVGGALGGSLESDDAVREAAYAHRPGDQRAPGADLNP